MVNSVQTCNAETQVACLCQKRRDGARGCIFHTWPQQCLPSHMLFYQCDLHTSLIVCRGLWAFPLKWADLWLPWAIAYGWSRAMWVLRMCHKNSTYFSRFLVSSLLEPSHRAISMTSMGIERYRWFGTEVLIRIFIWTSSWQPAPTCQPSWKWILEPPPKPFWLIHVEQRWASPLCLVQFMSPVNGYCCFKPWSFGVHYARIDNQNRWANKILKWLKIRLVSFFYLLSYFV